MLRLEGLTAGYHGQPVINDLSVRVDRGEIVALLGANGAGKTTTLKTITGLIRPQAGRVLFDGAVIHDWPPHRIARRGLVLVPEGRRLFPRLSVQENVELGAYSVAGRPSEPGLVEEIIRKFPVIQERSRQLAATLSGGEQQVVAILRALMASPKVVLLDEPSLGLAPRPVRQVFEVIARLKEQGLGVLLVEQNVRLALGIAQRAYVLEGGRIVAEGSAASLADSELVRRAYLRSSG
ncbi:MAG: ABC transporter ATP-binding protein [Candidatus Rokubacteria bacterium]|nr:ABC transporter ATP-binding protein [Candidatus Rokubacteria bacterium]